MWKLKESEAQFQVTREGPFEYLTFIHGTAYKEIPEEEKNRFEEIISQQPSMRWDSNEQPSIISPDEGGENQ
jgi:hypothetical protein